ncbi:hypothetical protein SAMN02745134_03286 [Clostridium acidisoli DSM 12555]|uniref:Uncharacterized protein n=1 Tax=Clostridium acidisoli DSM 12555 TaxID=1121291 RepID=A0A1W1XUZ0_9CLOT|nr:hypothetical protein [Clostridium acidisoli]SMC27763.1 hypothetical protein SAMN02745134_03286 [Clostridium acidisoli DSM 12555]
MESEQEQKVGAGIKTIAIIELVFETLGLLSSIFYLVFKDKINSAVQAAGVTTNVSSSTYVIALITSILIIISVILILLKNTIGVFGYFIVYIANIIYSIVKVGKFSPVMLVSFILPILMAIFIYRKRSIFKISRGEEE